MIPKFHGAKLTDIPDADLLEILVSSCAFCIKMDDGYRFGGETTGVM